MMILVSYDVATADGIGARRLRRVAKICESYGVRVQKSLFECIVGEKEFVRLQDSLLKTINADTDSLRIYFLDEKAREKVEHYGTNIPRDLEKDTLTI